MDRDEIVAELLRDPEEQGKAERQRSRLYMNIIEKIKNNVKKNLWGNFVFEIFYAILVFGYMFIFVSTYFPTEPEWVDGIKPIDDIYLPLFYPIVFICWAIIMWGKNHKIFKIVRSALIVYPLILFTFAMVAVLIMFIWSILSFV